MIKTYKNLIKILKDNLPNSRVEIVTNGDPLNKLIDRITNSDDLLNIIYFLAVNEKLLIFLIISKNSFCHLIYD